MKPGWQWWNRARTLRWAGCGLLVTAGLLTAGAASSQSPGGAGTWLTVRGQGRCLQHAALVANTRRYLEGRAPSGEVAIQVEVEGRGVLVTVRGAEHRAERRFQRLPRRCRDRRRALGLAMALAIESVGAGRVVGAGASTASPGGADESPTSDNPEPPAGEATSGRPATGPPAAAEPPKAGGAPQPADAQATTETAQATANAASDVVDQEPSDPTAPESEPPPAAEEAAGATDPDGASGTSVSLLAGGGLLSGASPGLAVVATAGANLQLGALSVAVEAGWAPDHDVRVGSVSADTALLFGRASGCFGGGLWFLRAEGCVGILAGALSAVGQGTDLAQAQRTRVGWLASAIGARLRVPDESRLGLRLRVDFHQNLVQPGLVVAGQGGGTALAGDFGISGFAALELKLW